MKCKDAVLKITMVCFLLMGFYLFSDQQAFAAQTKITSVDYKNENIVITNGSNTKFFFATDTDAAKEKWDVLFADAGTTTTIDFSWLPSSMENVVVIKGDVEKDPVKITINKKPSKLNITINYSSVNSLQPTDSIASLVNIMSTEGTGKNPLNFGDLEWRKGENGQWANTDSLTVALLEKYSIKGTTIHFRISALNDIPDSKGYLDGSEGRRYSDYVKLKIVKTAPAMVTGVDGGRFTASIKYGKEYRVTVTHPDGSVGKSNWIKVDDRAIKSVSLADIANSATPKYGSVVYDGETVAFPKMLIETRSYATAKAPASKISEIYIENPQRILSKAIKPGLPDANTIQDEKDIYVSYVGNKQTMLTIPLASSTLPYEYCILKPGEKLDIARASWTAVTKGVSVKILASKAVDGGTLYVRQKEIKSKAKTKSADAIPYQLASTYVSHKIDYPSVPVATKGIVTYVKNFTTTPSTITIQLNASGKVPFETAVKSIKLGTREIEFTSATTTSPADPKVSILTLTLKNESLAILPNCTNKPLVITYTNGTVDKTSVKITIKSAVEAAKLKLSASQGSTAGKTKIKVDGYLGAGNSWVYVVGTTEVTGIVVDEVLPLGTGLAFNSGDDILVTADQYITIYELNNTRNIIKYKSILIKAADIL